jgi:hypothetical protein
MPEMLLINPRKRRAARKTTKRRATKRRRNPINTIRSRSVAPRRRTNPVRYIKRRMSRRRRNPINLGGSAKGFMTQLRDALIGGAGAIAVDAAYARIAPMLPAKLQPVPGSVGAGDAVKALVTVMLGKLLSKPTKGLSAKLAHGALTVQAHGIMKVVLPASVTGGMGYYSPAAIADMSARVGPIRRGAMNAYVPGTQLLNAYAQPGRGSPVLSASPRVREGVTVR